MHFCVSTLATALVGALAVKAAPSLPRSTGSSDLTNPKACALTGSNISVVRHDGGHVTNETNVTQYDILWGNTSKKNPPCKGDPVFAIGLVKKGAKRPDSIVSLDWVSGGLAVQGNDFETLLAMPGTSPGEYTAHYFQYDTITGRAFADATTRDFTFAYQTNSASQA